MTGSRQVVAWSQGCGELIVKGQDKTFKSYRKGLYFNYSGGYTGGNICQIHWAV